MLSGGPLAPPEGDLVEALRRAAGRRDRGVTTYDALGARRRLSYAELWERARGAAGALEGHGDVAILQLEDLEAHVVAFWGCLLAGVRPLTVAVPPAWDPEHAVVRKLLGAWKTLGGPPVIGGRGVRDGLAAIAPEVRVFAVEARAAVAPEPRATSRDVAFLQLSSGSTGTPKIIPIRHAGVLAHVAGAVAQVGYGDDERSLNWLPMDHVVPTLTFHLKDVVLGADQVLVATGYVLADPLRWLDLLERERVTRTWAPNFAYALVADRVAPGRRWALGGVRSWMNAGEQVTAPVLRRFLAALADSGVRPRHLLPAYGMAELCTTMTHHVGFDPGRVLRVDKRSLTGVLEATEEPGALELVDCGPPAPGVDLRIVDAESGTPVTDRVIGRLQVRGAVVTPGYLENPAANAEAFTTDGWFDTGDLGVLWEGRLALTGRRKEMIIVRGANLTCHEVEDVVSADPIVEPTWVAAVGVPVEEGTESLAIFFVPRGEDLEAGRAARVRITAEVTRRLGVRPTWIVPVARADFPRTTSGKIQRLQLRDRLVAGELAPTSGRRGNQPTNEDLPARVRAVLSLVRTVLPEAEADLRLVDAGADSLVTLQLVGRLQEELGIRVGAGALLLATPRALASLPVSRATTPTPAEPAGPFPLTFSQLWLWTVRLDAGTHLRNLVSRSRIEGFPSTQHETPRPGSDPVTALRRALPALVARHGALRTAIGRVVPTARILPAEEVKLAVEEVDLTGLPPDRREEVVLERYVSLRDTPMPLDHPPALRAVVLRVGPGAIELLLAVPHILCDPTGHAVLRADLAALLANTDAPPPAEPSLAVVAAEDRAALRLDAARLGFWRAYGERVGDPRVRLPSRLRAVRAGPFRLPTVPLGEEDLQALALRARARGATLGTALLAAWMRALQGFAPQHPRITSLVLRSTRTTPARARMPGVFLDYDVVSAELDERTSFPDLLAAVSADLLAGAEHAVPEAVRLGMLERPGRLSPLLAGGGRLLARALRSAALPAPVVAGYLALAASAPSGDSLPLLPLFDLYPAFFARPPSPELAAGGWRITPLRPDFNQEERLRDVENEGTLEIILTRDHTGTPRALLQSPLDDHAALDLLERYAAAVAFASRA